jgi:hypothetical protein
MNTESKSMLWRGAYRLGYEVGFAIAAIATLVNFVMFPFPRY